MLLSITSITREVRSRLVKSSVVVKSPSVHAKTAKSSIKAVRTSGSKEVACFALLQYLDSLLCMNVYSLARLPEERKRGREERICTGHIHWTAIQRHETATRDSDSNRNSRTQP